MGEWIMTGRKRKRYSDEFRATALTMLKAEGYPDKKGALTKVAAHLDIPLQTLFDWARKDQNPPPMELRNEKEGDLVALLKARTNQAVEEMKRAIGDTSFKDLCIGTAILIEKTQLLTGEPTERREDVSGVGRERVRGALSSIASREAEEQNTELPQ